MGSLVGRADMSRIELLFTVEPRDVGRVEVERSRGDAGHRVFFVGDVCGPLQHGDIGKRVYLVGDVMQIENAGQRDERKAKAAAKRGAR